MLRRLLGLGRQSLTYLLAFALPPFLGVLLLPLYTRFLTPSDYGITAVCSSITGLLGAFYHIGLLSALTRQFFDHRQDLLQLRRYISTITIFLGGHGLCLSLIAVSFGRPFAQAVVPEVPFSPHLQVAIWASYFNLASMLLLTLFRSEMRATAYLIFTAAHACLTTVLTIHFVVVLGQGALGYLTASLISNAMFGIAALWLLRRHLALCFDRAMFISSLSYGLPLLPEAIGAWMFSVADRVMLSSLVNTTEAGLYSLGVQITSAVGLVAAATNFAWRPFLFSQLSEKGDAAKSELARFATYWVLAMCAVYLLTSGFGREILWLLTPTPYHESERVVPLLALGLLFGGFYYVFVNLLLWQGKTAQVSIATVISGLVNIVLNLLFLPRWQMVGAALATVLANMVLLLMVGCAERSTFAFPFEYRRMAKVVAVAAVCQVLLVLTTHLAGGIWLQVAVKLLIVAIFPLLLCVIRFPGHEEIAAVRSLASQGCNRLRKRQGT